MTEHLEKFLATKSKVYRMVALFGAQCILDDLEQCTDPDKLKEDFKQLVKTEIA